MKLKQTSPQDAEHRYLKDKETHVSKKILYNYSTTLDSFTDWVTDQGIDYMQDVDSDYIDQFKHYRLSSVKVITARNDMMTIRNFIEYCERIQAVPRGLSERIPKTDESDEIYDDLLTREEARAIQDHLEKFEYASDRHVIFLVLWKTGTGLSGLRAIDFDDFDTARPALEIRHRPESGTPLEKKQKGERDVIISRGTADVISDYIENVVPA